MNILLCSGRESVLERWSSILAARKWTIFKVNSFEMLQAAVRQDEPYLLLVHQSFVDPQVIARLNSAVPNSRIFILSDTPNPDDGTLLLKLGVIGYASTYIAPARLIEAVKAVLSGRVWFGQEIISRLIRSIAPPGEPAGGSEPSEILAPLTQREREIALLVAEGLSNLAIGDRLYISERTVKAHLGSIFAKTGAQSRVKLALLISKGMKEGH
ncbi:MAG: response regulator transcription factor [Desulfobulbaceae bacterium]|jgi:DNA-binding NarL/FixJ family response regulator|nr:response regulator transcription factor [Desulfobulbaceae bacterium]MDY0352173.1 response regulator transcription factor [Desulfobulbaceae bacterium]